MGHPRRDHHGAVPGAQEGQLPKYAEVPEVSFLRTYVREDTAKCLCFYNAPDEAAVERARQAVGTPFDRLFKLNV
ncbi:DUF4242 domain-containing protein [Kocuria rosea]|uniref:DUF4242 domain-containing protein n=1 Tax=Kocuria rosea TaxID=1275 RepID=UPI00215D9ABD|nr:DUF4242 domain-containing protein [Kocuria rosea]